MTTSLRACLAAEAWQKLKDTMPETRGGDQRPGAQSKKANFGLFAFEQFAEERFKVGKTYAKQALTILNHSKELFEAAKDGVSQAHEIYRKEAAARSRELERTKLVDSHADLSQDVANGRSFEEAYNTAIARQQEADTEAAGEMRRWDATLTAIFKFMDAMQSAPMVSADEYVKRMDMSESHRMVEGIEAERLTLERGIKLLQCILKEKQ